MRHGVPSDSALAIRNACLVSLGLARAARVASMTVWSVEFILTILSVIRECQQRFLYDAETMGGKPRRRRLPADQAQAAILDAAERQLVERGPDGIRLQDLADELGISHPAILHHFGSRAGLLRALVTRTGERLQRELIDTISRGVDEKIAASVLERSFEVLADRKHARTL